MTGEHFDGLVGRGGKQEKLVARFVGGHKVDFSR